MRMDVVRLKAARGVSSLFLPFFFFLLAFVLFSQPEVRALVKRMPIVERKKAKAAGDEESASLLAGSAESLDELKRKVGEEQFQIHDAFLIRVCVSLALNWSTAHPAFLACDSLRFFFSSSSVTAA